MKTSKIVDALNYIDEDLVAEAVTYRPKEEEVADEIIKISEANGKEMTMKKKGKIAKRTLLVAALIVVLVLGTLTVAVAAFRGSLSEGLKNLFHISAEQEEELLGREDDFLQIYGTEEIYIKESLIEEETKNNTDVTVGETIDSKAEEGNDNYVLSETYQGITVSVKETLVDSYYVNMVLRVEGFSEEQAPNIEYGRLRVWAEGESLGSMSGHMNILEDGIIEFTLSYNAAKGKIPGWYLGKDVEVIWENMCVRDESMRKQPIVEHTWHLTWNLKGINDRLVWNLNTALGDSGAVVENIELTEASIRVNYDWPRQTVPVVLADGSIGNEVKEPPMLTGIILKDGTVHMGVTEFGGSGYHAGSLQKYYVERKFTQLFDLDEIESVLFYKENPDDNIPAVDNKPLEVEDCYIIHLREEKMQENTNNNEEVSHDNLSFYCNGVIATWATFETDEEMLQYGLYLEDVPENLMETLEFGSYEVYVDNVLLTESSMEEWEINLDEWIIIESRPRPRKHWMLTVVPDDMGVTMDDYIGKQLKLVINDLVVRNFSGKEEVVVEGRWELRYTIQIYQ